MPDSFRTGLPRDIPPEPKGLYMSEVMPRLVDALSEGASIAGACRYAGLTRHVFDYWMARGDPDSEDYQESAGNQGRDYPMFYKTIMATLGNLEVEVAGMVKRQGHRDYRAGIEILSRRFPSDWSPPVSRSESKALVVHDFGAIAESVRQKLLPEFAITEVVQLQDGR